MSIALLHRRHLHERADIGRTDTARAHHVGRNRITFPLPEHVRVPSQPNRSPIRTRYRLYRMVFPSLPRWVATLLALA